MPGEISLVVKNEDGSVRTSVAISISQDKLKNIRDWRQLQIRTPAVAVQYGEDGSIVVAAQPAVLKWNSDGAMWKQLIVDWVRTITHDADEALAAIQSERAKIEAAKAAIEAIKNAAIG